MLKKLGLILSKIGTVAAEVAGFGPIINTFLPAKVAAVAVPVEDTFTKIGGQVATIETAFAAIGDPSARTGSEKLTAAAPLVSLILKDSELLAGKKIVDQAKYEQGVNSVTSGVADILSSVGD
ncbi:MAG: hypothetical protein WB780_07440 [Candidatus Acidiferrales bacterium]